MLDITPEQTADMDALARLFRIWMPYQFVRLKSPPNRYIYLPVNRNYKPLGHASDKWANYEDFRQQAVRFKKDPRKFEGIWDSSDPNGDWFYLYDGYGGDSQLREYYVRLKILSMYSEPAIGKETHRRKRVMTAAEIVNGDAS